VDSEEARLISFRVDQTSGQARTGVLSSPHGEVPTPAFMPVGTQAVVKGVSVEELIATGAKMQIMNTYHLWIRPGPELIAEFGGLHGFGRWPHTIVTIPADFRHFPWRRTCAPVNTASNSRRTSMARRCC